jgi:hypothetical protein
VTLRRAFLRWVEAEMPRRTLVRFRIAFALVWLGYDVVDLLVGGTASAWRFQPVGAPPALAATQTVLVGLELLILVGWRVEITALFAAGMRILEVNILPLNDFFYYIVVAVVLSRAGVSAHYDGEPAPERVPQWPRDLLLYQMAWIYACTALLKLSPEWLSGDHLWVRHQLLLESGTIPYPAFYRRCAESLACNAWLARLGVISEGVLAALLVLRRPRLLIVGLALGIHGFAAAAMNVFFFGLSIVFELAILVPGAPEPTVRMSPSAVAGATDSAALGGSIGL